jgi:hypothetical protein
MENRNTNKFDTSSDSDLVYKALEREEGNEDQVAIFLGDAAFKASLRDEKTLQNFLSKYPPLKWLREMVPRVIEYMEGEPTSTDKTFVAKEMRMIDFIEYLAGKEIPEELEHKGLIIHTIREFKKQPRFPWPEKELTDRADKISTNQNHTGGAW